MAIISRYRKPSLTNMPAELGKRVFKEILSSSAPDRKKMHEESLKLEKAMMKEMEKYEKDE